MNGNTIDAYDLMTAYEFLLSARKRDWEQAVAKRAADPSTQELPPWEPFEKFE